VTVSVGFAVTCSKMFVVCCQKPAPSELLTMFDVPDVSSIHFHTVVLSSNHAVSTLPANPLFPLADIPVVFQLDDIKTNFVMVRI